jgi:hypothetical protein
MNKQHEDPLSSSSPNFASTLVTQRSMSMNDSYGQTYLSIENHFDPSCVNTYLSIENHFDPSCVNYFSIVEQENLSLNSSAPFSRPTTIKQVMLMNDLYSRSNSDDSTSYLERSYAPSATRPEVVSHVFYVPNAHAFEPQSKFCSLPTRPMPESHVQPEFFGDELDRSISRLKESFSENIFRTLQQVFLPKQSSLDRIKTSDDTSEAIHDGCSSSTRR